MVSVAAGGKHRATVRCLLALLSVAVGYVYVKCRPVFMAPDLGQGGVVKTHIREGQVLGKAGYKERPGISVRAWFY